MISPISPSQYLREIITTNNMSLEDVSKLSTLMICTLKGILTGTIKIDSHAATCLGQLPSPVGCRRYVRRQYHAQKWRRIQQSWDDYCYVPPQNEPIILRDRPSIEDKLKPIIGNIREKILSWNK